MCAANDFEASELFPSPHECPWQKKFPLADTLSRKYLPDTLSSICDDLEAQAHMVSSTLPMSSSDLDKVRSDKKPYCTISYSHSLVLS
jgi:hypothetical protein